jgi:hypothetical protein
MLSSPAGGSSGSVSEEAASGSIANRIDAGFVYSDTFLHRSMRRLD